PTRPTSLHTLPLHDALPICLSPNTRRILNTAAVIGRVFDIDLAIAAGAGPEEEALDALDEGIIHAVIEPAEDISGSQFSFTHGRSEDATSELQSLTTFVCRL